MVPEAAAVSSFRDEGLVASIVRICDGVYVDEGDELGPEERVHEGRLLHRFMDKFYIRCETDELTPIEVDVLCRARASKPSTILRANSVVQELFRGLVRLRNPARLLEIGAGASPVFQDGGWLGDPLSYVKCDAAPDHANGWHVFSGFNAELPLESDYFDMAIAVFVLHFHFYASQVVELHRCMAPKGVFIANIYRRKPASLMRLNQSFGEAGFFVETLPDPHALCQDHQYWVVGKDREAVGGTLSELASLASKLPAT